MKFYLDTANVEVIKRVARLGLVDGVTTDPSLIAKEGRDFKVIIEEISSLIPGPISAEVIAKSASDILKEAEAINEWGSNVVVRLPMTERRVGSYAYAR
ncbi:transaldolase [Paenibacillus phyllosphaerae]|uniref:Transaldolase n=1 Tax=Paenibacillus phyllosphaerae TaxID=274593 RepID=A0A7W5B2C7_9BACL|nr:transaldolase [Paenibacillus phyllosphaerae]